MVKWMNFGDKNVFLCPNFAKNRSEFKKNSLSSKILLEKKNWLY